VARADEVGQHQARLIFRRKPRHAADPGRNGPNDGDLVDLIPEWIEEAAAQKQILVDNPRKLYGFPSRRIERGTHGGAP
jgi:hypothetical protein